MKKIVGAVVIILILSAPSCAIYTPAPYPYRNYYSGYYYPTAITTTIRIPATVTGTEGRTAVRALPSLLLYQVGLYVYGEIGVFAHHEPPVFYTEVSRHSEIFTVDPGLGTEAVGGVHLVFVLEA